MKVLKSAFILGALVISLSGHTQTNPLWKEAKVKNYLPHMTVPEVREFLTKSDMVIIPVAAIEQHGLHLPLGTDFLNGVEEAKLIAQRTDVLVAPVLLAGQSPYHMEFPGTISISPETIVQVHLEAVQSLIKHGFKRFMILNSHAGNKAVSAYLADRINQETAGIAVELGEGAAPFLKKAEGPKSTIFDRHAGVNETSSALYLIPSLVNLQKAETAKVTLPAHMQAMVPEVVAGDRTASLVFLAEGLKAKETGKKTSAAEMSTTGVWGLRDPKEATSLQGQQATENFVNAAVAFIEKWKKLRPLKP